MPELEDVKYRLRELERKRMEDRDRLIEMETLTQERDKLERIIARLEGKIKPMFDTQQELQAQLSQLEIQRGALEREVRERTDQFEIVTMDKEVAEEKYEVLQEDFKLLKLQLEESILEKEILAEENELFKKGTSEERDESTWSQIQGQNDRLKKALIMLRDTTDETEKSLRAEINKLQRDVDSLQNVQKEYDITISKLKNAEEIIEDLRQRLDLAHGAERMLEEITVKNLNLGEQIEELRSTIQDLETLREINEELESNHAEAFKQLQEDIDYRDLVIREQGEKIASMEDAAANYEYIVGRFRDLVSSLQTDLEQVKSENAKNEISNVEINRRTMEMLELNQKLHASALRGQVKTIDLELRKLEAQEAIEHLSIIREYMPDSLAIVREAIKTLLLFRRITFKSTIILSAIRDILSDPSRKAINKALLCELLIKLSSISVICESFVVKMYVSDLSEFENYGSLQQGVSQCELVLDNLITDIKQDEIVEREFINETQNVLQILHTLLNGKLNLAEKNEEVMQTFKGGFQNMFTTTESSILVIRYIIDFVVSEYNTNELNQELPSNNPIVAFETKGELLLSKLRTMKTLLSNGLGLIDELATSHLIISCSTFGQDLETVTTLNDTVAKYLINLSFSVALRFEKTVGSSAPPKLSDMLNIMNLEAQNTSNKLQTSDEYFGAAIEAINTISKRTRNLSDILTSGDRQAFEPIRPPWLVKVDGLREQESADKRVIAGTVQLNEDLKQLATQLRLKDANVEESNIKIQLLESQMDKNQERIKKLSETERELLVKSSSEKGLQTKLKDLNVEIEKLKHENIRLADLAKTNASASKELNNLKKKVQGASIEEVQLLNKQITTLQATIRYLQGRVISSDTSDVNQIGTKLDVAFLTSPVIKPTSKKSVTNILSSLKLSDAFDNLIKITHNAKLTHLDVRKKQEWRPLTSRNEYITARQADEYGLIIDNLRS
ncbi:dynein associated protein-domain-containing protein [Lipomyces japonicus]|uniref:dynein associated protein-domain-containing protein n=1 Tax=Lipomyces japonicus TaxID=56871 RepID=UPI0034CD6C04